MGETAHGWIQGALVSAASVAVVYWYTWSTDRTLDVRQLVIMAIITFIAAFLADLLGDEIIQAVKG